MDSHPARLRQAVRRRAGELALQVGAGPELHNRAIIQPRGRGVLGGSSSINGLLYLRGQPADCDHWRQLGNTGWSFDDVLPYFRSVENQERGENELHGVGGPLVGLQCLRAASAVRSPFIEVSAAGQLSAQRRLQRAQPRRAPATSSSPRSMAAAGPLRSAI